MELDLSIYDSRTLRMDDRFAGAPGAAYKKYWPDLQKMELQYRIAIATGQKPLDSDDQFIAEWKKNGGDEVVKEVNAWWQANKQ